ncbi:MAG: hypothetical protein NTU61_02210 [Candidatus Altiarchaeota archaeon]|nr:hypothetical protein [Candidatus Altiarchaeota archaeon]
MPLVCPMSGCRIEAGLCTHDKIVMAIAIIIGIFSLMQALRIV